jgi:hypothetical protein
MRNDIEYLALRLIRWNYDGNHAAVPYLEMTMMPITISKPP